MRPEALRATLALVAVLLAGCAAPAADLASMDDAATTDALDLVRVTGVLTREPAIVQHPGGALFVAGFPGGSGGERLPAPLLWRSVDGGASWERVAQGDVASGALGNSDADLAVAPDGTLYHAVLTYFPWGHAILVGASGDEGATWRWSTLAAMPWVDRPWVEVAPDGVAHVTWSSPRGLHHASSRDGGATWTEGPLVHPSGGSGGLAVGPDGELAVRFFPLRGPTFLLVAFPFVLVDPDADGVAVSTDGGASWTLRELPGERAYVDALGNGGDGVPRWADPLAFDANGTLYAAWSEGDKLLVASSRDLGATWSTHPLAQAEDSEALFFPYLAAGAAGELAASWYSDGSGGLRAHVARVASGDTAAPRVDAVSLEAESGDDTMGEYFQVALLDDGRVAAALPLGGADAASSGFVFLARR